MHGWLSAVLQFNVFPHTSFIAANLVMVQSDTEMALTLYSEKCVFKYDSQN